jgi:nicotinamide mononucleotide adenylyltransferase
MKKIGIYPGNFQPATKAHLEVYKRLKSIVGPDCFIVTTDREPTPDAPLNFGDKQQILVRHGVPSNHIIKVSVLPIDNIGRVNEWRPNEIFNNFSAEQTTAICVFNEKDAATFLRQKGNEKSKYFQPYKGNENLLRPFKEHAYVMVLDDSRIDGKPISTSNIRKVLGSPKYNDNQKKKFFAWIFGWFDIGLYKLMVSKFRMAMQSATMEESVKSKLPVVTLKRRLEELVYEILREETMDEDYSTTINDPSSSSTNNLTGGMNGNDEESPAQQKANAAKTKQDLVKKKQKAERELKGLRTDLQWKQADVLRKRKDELPGKRKEIDAINKQLSTASSTTSVSSNN